MGGITALWLLRLETAVPLGLVTVTGWIVSLLLPLPSTTGSLHQNGRPDHLGHPSHAGPGIWYAAPRAALTGWSISGLSAAGPGRHPRAGTGTREPVTWGRTP